MKLTKEETQALAAAPAHPPLSPSEIDELEREWEADRLHRQRLQHASMVAEMQREIRESGGR